MQRINYTIPPALDGRTVGNILRHTLDMADGLISSLKFMPDGILLDGQRVRVSAPVHTGSVLSAALGRDGTNPAAPRPEPADIRWQDEYFAVVNKSPGTAVYGEPGPNLAGIFASLWGQDIAFRPVNRLDVGTSGLLVIARSAYMHDRLRRLLHTDAFRREYLAVCQGCPKPMSGSITLPLAAAVDGTTRRTVSPDGQNARTDYRVLQTDGNRSLLRLRLYTGRTHQIRAHMAALGCPLCGDTLYGARDCPLPRPALHSEHLVLTHPLTGEVLDITADMPEDMAKILPAPVEHNAISCYDKQKRETR